MHTHQQRSPAAEIEELYAIAVREHGPEARSSKILREELDRELRRVAQAGDRQDAPATARRGEEPRRGRREH